jgi:OHCU decarboxylase
VRANPSEYELVAPGTLPAVLSLLASEPGAWLPIAGGTDLMVLYSAGKLPSRKLVSIWNLPELRRVEILPDEIQIGAGVTYTDLRNNEVISREFSLLAQSASWTGSIANQNRGTLGGNIVNASPAADSLPALLAYGTELLLVSAHGERRIPYSTFHIGYRKTQLAPDELLRAVCLLRRFSTYHAYSRKVGPRNAQAISKVCLAGLARLDSATGESVASQKPTATISDIRLAIGSVAPVPLRLQHTERAIIGKRIDASLLQLARTKIAAEIQPIDDIRSTARYRAAVAANLVAEFLQQLAAAGENATPVAPSTQIGSLFLARWNSLSPNQAATEILACCGSTAWANEMAARRPIQNESDLLSISDEIWNRLPESDWLEAFRSHPRIGQSHAPASATAQSASWSTGEQRDAATTNEDITSALAAGNREYEQRFGRIFLVCAAGKSAAEILEILRRRLHNDHATELREAAEQQRQITQLRLKKWLRQIS